MKTTHVNIFTGTEIIVKGLKHQLNDAHIPFIIKNRVESARLAGFGTPANSVSIYVKETDLEIAISIVNEYKKSIR